MRKNRYMVALGTGEDNSYEERLTETIGEARKIARSAGSGRIYKLVDKYPRIPRFVEEIA